MAPTNKFVMMNSSLGLLASLNVLAGPDAAGPGPLCIGTGTLGGPCLGGGGPWLYPGCVG